MPATCKIVVKIDQKVGPRTFAPCPRGAKNVVKIVLKVRRRMGRNLEDVWGETLKIGFPRWQGTWSNLVGFAPKVCPRTFAPCPRVAKKWSTLIQKLIPEPSPLARELQKSWSKVLQKCVPKKRQTPLETGGQASAPRAQKTRPQTHLRGKGGVRATAGQRPGNGQATAKQRPSNGQATAEQRPGNGRVT